MTYITNNGMDLEDLKKLYRGDIFLHKCPFCDNNGQVYYDMRYGEGSKDTPSGIDPEWLTSENCDNCFGLGFVASPRLL